MTNTIDLLREHLIDIISETNGITLTDTLELSENSNFANDYPKVKKQIHSFRRLLSEYQQNEVEISTLLEHPLSSALFGFFKDFPLKYNEEHIHLTGSLTAEFIYPRLKKLLEGPSKDALEKKIIDVYGDEYKGINCVEDVDKLIRLKDDEEFDRYLKILLLPKLILIDKKAHEEASYHMAKELYEKYNVGKIRLKFTFSRATSNESDKIPGFDVTEEDVVVGLYDGFKKFKDEHEDFEFVLSPCFRKESDFFDSENFKTKQDHFNFQIDQILEIIEKNPQLRKYVTDVDTVGSERDLYRKGHFFTMQQGFRKLQYQGFRIRSHHGETFHTLRKGVQAVDNSMNIWHINTLEHGLSLGINPNYYYHSFFQRVLKHNQLGKPISPKDKEGKELMDLEWSVNTNVRDKIIQGIVLSPDEITLFVKAKFHTAREVEHYQHDVLNRMINKGVSLIALPSSNKKLTGSFIDYKDHPFTWWEKKGVKLGIGTDNYITLNTNFVQELLIVLFSDANNLKITKLLMIATYEHRRPYISQLLWKMKKKLKSPT
jgi:adenosine deaminase